MSVEELAQSRHFRILSLAGGGFLGLFTIQTLVNLEEEFGYPIADKFDLIAGTSVGGLIALALAKHIPTCELERVFRLRGKEVFRASFFEGPLGLIGIKRYIFASRFASEKLRHLVAELVGHNADLSSLKARILIPAFNLSKARPDEFRNSGQGRTSNLPLTDIALATTAAPTYFPIHLVGGELYADGAIHANTPDILAISEAMAEHHVDLKDISMLSIGTTFSRRPITQLKRRNAGAITWLGKLQLVDRLLEAQNQGSIFLSDRFLGERYIRVNKFLEPNLANRLSLARADEFAASILQRAAVDAWHALRTNPKKWLRLQGMIRAN